MTCQRCKYHETLYSTVNGEMMPTNLFRCRSHLQQAKYTKRVLTVGHKIGVNCRFNSELEIDVDQIKIEI